MTDFLMREDAPLSAEEWSQIDAAVVGVAKKLLVGRRLIEIFGPLGPGTQHIAVSRYQVTEACLHKSGGGQCGEGCQCDGDCDPVDLSGREIIELPLIHKDFVLRWRDIAASRQLNMPLDVSPAMAAAAMVAQKEDQLIFGDLLASAGTKVSAADWQEPGNAFANMVAAASALAQAGFFGPYAAAVSPAVYALMHRPMKGGMGILEIKQVKELASGGVYQTPALKDNQALLISQGAHNLDLVLAQDLTTAYLGPDKMEHLFRVMESLALRVKRPGAVCVIG